MSKEESSQITTKCIDCLSIVYIACSQENHGSSVMMAPITEEQEKELDNEECIVIKANDDKSFVITAKECYAYGALDLTPNSDDIEKISKADWFRGMYINIHLFTQYDYQSHTVTSDVAGGRWYESDNIKKYLPFLYAKLGKPERVVIFREEFDMLKTIRKRAKRNKSNKAHYNASKDYYKTYNKNKTEAKRKAKISSLQFKIKK